MTTWDIVCADIQQWADEYAGPPFHAVLCDAPYEMREIDIDNLGAQGKGFMNSDWDGSGVSFDPDTWRGIARHLLPGAFLFVFAGTINDDLISLAMRRAGLRKHHKAVLYHAQGQGFPKSTKICSQLDKHGGESVGWFGPWLRKWRQENGITQKEIAELFPSKTGSLTGCVANWELGLNMPTVEQFNTICEHFDLPFESLEEAEREVTGKGNAGAGKGKPLHNGGFKADYDITAPATPLAQAWAGHRYGLQSLKPSVESILIFQKPYAGKSVDSIVETGAGALNIDKARISVGNDYRDAGWGPRYGASSMPNMGSHQTRPWVENAIDENRPVKDSKPGSGRWPANLLLAHIAPSTCPTCDGDGCDTCDGEGLVGGCRRVGEKKIKGNIGIRGSDKGNKMYGGGKGLNRSITGQRVGYANSDGREVVADWQCVDGWLLILPEPCPYCGTKQDFKFKLRSGIVPWGTVVDFDSYEVKCQRCQEQYDFELEHVQCPVKALGEQSGERPSGGQVRGNEPSASTTDRVYSGGYKKRSAISRRGDTGTAARYFHQSDWTAERIEHAAPVHYQAKSSRSERDAGLERKKTTIAHAAYGDFKGTPEHATNMKGKQRNPHPTTKPIALAKHLATLLLPPPEYAPRRLLIPFAGSGSEAIGAMLAGWEEIVCIELIQDYCTIAEARLAWWADWLAYTGVDDPKELLRLSNNDKVRKEKEAARLV